MLKQFEGLKKRNLCREEDKRFYKQGDVTICVVSFNIPQSIFKWNDSLQRLVERKFPNVVCLWNNIAGQACPTCTVVAHCSPKKGDKYDEKKGETIAYSKAQRKMYSITTRILVLASNWAAEESAKLERAAAFMAMTCDREQRFIDSL